MMVLGLLPPPWSWMSSNKAGASAEEERDGNRLLHRVVDIEVACRVKWLGWLKRV